MKKFLLLPILTMASMLTMQAQTFLTVNGTVSNNGGVPVSVLITVNPNSVPSYVIKSMTDSSGNYSDTITIPDSLGTVIVLIVDCNRDSITASGTFYANPAGTFLTLNLNYCSASCVAMFAKSQAIDTVTRLPIPYSVQITDMSYGTGLSYLWDFGDGTTSTSLNVSHTYSTYGPYLLCLAVTNSLCTDTFCDMVMVDSSGNVKGAGNMTIIIGAGSSPLGLINQPKINQSFEVFPNPVSDILNIRSVKQNNSNTRMDIYSADGKLVMTSENIFQGGNANTTVETKQLQKGLYFIRLFSGDLTESLSFYKN